MAEDTIRRIIRELQTDLDRAVKAALEPVVAEAKARCPREPGGSHHLQDAIHIEEQLEGIYVVAGDNRAWYGHLVEFGSYKTGERFTRNRVGTQFHGHEGREGHTTGVMPAHPFLTPAFEANRTPIIESARVAVNKLAR